SRIVLAGWTLLSSSPCTSISRPLRFAASSALVGTLISNFVFGGGAAGVVAFVGVAVSAFAFTGGGAAGVMPPSPGPLVFSLTASLVAAVVSLTTTSFNPW